MIRLFALTLAGILAANHYTVAQDLNCDFREQIDLPPNLILRHIANQADRTLKVELIYPGIGWLSIGPSPAGMIGSVAVLGLPGEPDLADNRNPAIRGVNGFSVAAVQPLGAEQQALLTEASIQQNETHTVLSFTQPLEGDGLLTIPLEGEANFVYAAGGNNDINSFHVVNTGARFPLSQCLEAGEDASDEEGPQVTFTGGASADQMQWKLHGYLMAVSWGVLIPMGIGASLMRNLFPPGMFFRIHQVINSLAVIGTIAGFGIAVVNIEKEANTHFDIAHMKIGLVVVVLAFIQAGLGYFRPHLPSAPKNGGPTPAKSAIRTYWEYKHRILGTFLLAAAWYACHTGIQQFAVKFAQNDEEELLAFWIVVGVIAGLVIVGTIVGRLRGNSEESSSAPNEAAEVEDEDESMHI